MHVHLAARVAVLPPGAADPGGLLEDGELGEVRCRSFTAAAMPPKPAPMIATRSGRRGTLRGSCAMSSSLSPLGGNALRLGQHPLGLSEGLQGCGCAAVRRGVQERAWMSATVQPFASAARRCDLNSFGRLSAVSIPRVTRLRYSGRAHRASRRRPRRHRRSSLRRAAERRAWLHFRSTRSGPKRPGGPPAARPLPRPWHAASAHLPDQDCQAVRRSAYRSPSRTPFFGIAATRSSRRPGSGVAGRSAERGTSHGRGAEARGADVRRSGGVGPALVAELVARGYASSRSTSRPRWPTWARTAGS